MLEPGPRSPNNLSAAMRREMSLSFAANSTARLNSHSPWTTSACAGGLVGGFRAKQPDSMPTMIAAAAHEAFLLRGVDWCVGCSDIKVAAALDKLSSQLLCFYQRLESSGAL